MFLQEVMNSVAGRMEKAEAGMISLKTELSALVGHAMQEVSYLARTFVQPQRNAFDQALGLTTCEWINLD